MKLLFLFLASSISIVSAGVSCDVKTQPSTWATIFARNVALNAWQPSDYKNLPGFCVLNDFHSHSLSYYSHVNLANYGAPLQKDTETFLDIDSSKVDCGFDSEKIYWCSAHCQNQVWQDILIQSALNNGPVPLDVSQQVYQQLDSPSDVSIAALSVNQSNPNVALTYDYYDDFNFCSVYIKINKPTEVPYVLLVTAQKVLVK